HRELGDAALQAVSAALSETQLYYKQLESDEGKSPDTEAELVRLWRSAAIPMRHVDQEFAEICQYKSQYWLEPSSWSREKVYEFRIELNSVQERFMRQLRKESFVGK
ncbi:MAG: hypothetical protein AB2826_25000, partial [Candidatus Thiodiazotropha sp.]